jgi:hypothetical protein
VAAFCPLARARTARYPAMIKTTRMIESKRIFFFIHLLSPIVFGEYSMKAVLKNKIFSQSSV